MIKIKGHSNYKVEFCIEKPKYLIKKSTNDKDDAERLYKQIEKQYNFRKYQKGNIMTPKIYNFEYNKINYSYTMKYIKESITMIEYIEESSISNIYNIYKNLIKIVNNNLINSNIENIKTEFINKYNSVVYKIKNNNNILVDNKFIDSINNYILLINNKYNEINIPIGICHGDLTFSNILVKGYNYYIIDFLDNFVETPLQDIVKLRQDTKYLWTLRLINFNIDTTKLIISLSVLDKMIDKYYTKYKWYNNHYIKFQILNLLRIIPYIKEQPKFDNIKHQIMELISIEI